jgi:hypothetical protein
MLNLKRVPMDFDYPLHHVWYGYKSPYASVNCPYCFNGREHGSDGWSPAARNMKNNFLRTSDPHWIQMDDYRYDDNAWGNHITQEECQMLWDNGDLCHFQEVPTPEMLRRYFNLHFGFGSEHTPLIRHRLGEDQTWCWRCKGEGEFYITPEIAKAAEEWEDIEPPEGEGFQAWEDVSAGSPISPVFSTLEELSDWCVQNKPFDVKATKEQWTEMFAKDNVHMTIGNATFV